LNIDPEDFPVVKKNAGNQKGKIIRGDKQNIKDQINWLLGEEPSGILNNSDLSWALRKTEDDYLGDVIGEPGWNGMKKMLIRPYNSMGDYLWGNLYLPDDAEIEDNSVKGNYPLVIYLHAYSYATGYRRRITPFLKKLTGQGFAVLAFDLVGFGTRIEEAGQFYDRYPKWSLMGKMVADTRNVINDAVERIGFIDPGRVFLCGYSLGGTVALFTAAMDDRVKGVAVAGSFGSFRLTDPATEGNKHFSHLHGLIPKLGFFEDHEARIPVDFDDVLSCVAPKPLYIIAPMEDRHHPTSHVETIMAPVQNLYKELGESQNLQFHQPETYDHFTGPMMDEMVKWIGGL